MIRSWLSRHTNPTNLLLHLAGIPATIAAVPLAIMHHWALAGGMFVAGYALQFLGHGIEGNRSGEGMLLRRAVLYTRAVRRRRKRTPPARPAGRQSHQGEP